MSLLRFAGRALFSSYFIADGYQMVAKPDKKADQVAGPVEFCVPLVQSVLPPAVADQIPSDVRTWTRILGVAQIVGGLAYATGIGRRPSAAALALVFAPQVITAAADDDRSALFAKLALLGGAVVATQDTAGRPGLAWKAEQTRKAAELRAEQTRKAAEQRAGQARKSVERRAAGASKDVERLQARAKAEAKQAQARAKKAADRPQAQVKEALN